MQTWSKKGQESSVCAECVTRKGWQIKAENRVNNFEKYQWQVCQPAIDTCTLIDDSLALAVMLPRRIMTPGMAWNSVPPGPAFTVECVVEQPLPRPPGMNTADSQPASGSRDLINDVMQQRLSLSAVRTLQASIDNLNVSLTHAFARISQLEAQAGLDVPLADEALADEALGYEGHDDVVADGQDDGVLLECEDR